MRLVAARALADRGAVVASLAGAPRVTAPLTIDAWLAFAREATRALGAEDARALLARVPREPTLHDVDGDALLAPIAVSLVAAGAIDASELGLNAPRRARRAPRRAAPASLEGLDARHRLLVLARTAPTSADALLLARDLSPQRARDPLVAVAFARLALAGAPHVTAPLEALARFDPADPLVAAAALYLALHAHDATAIPLAKKRLAAVASTLAERAKID